jgi:adenylate cyclase
MPISCPDCSTANPDEARFCLNCGARLPVPATIDLEHLELYLPKGMLAKLEAARVGRSMEGERRVVTMLFCDVKGSTAMAETLDPEEWAEIMNGAFERLIAPVYRYEGTLARLMGDAIFAFFGAPIAHEDDPQRARSPPGWTSSRASRRTERGSRPNAAWIWTSASGSTRARSWSVRSVRTSASSTRRWAMP